jgi:electron transfer flavoprotein beta subunit
MHIVVCIKQVPEIERVKVDSGTGKVIVPEDSSMINPFDEYAIEEALRIKEKHGGTVTVLTMGPASAAEALRSALALGADEAVHLMDPAFDGSDAAATATLLAAGIGKLDKVSLVLFGRNAVDTDASSVPGYVAGRLNWPQVLFVRKFVELSADKSKVERMTEDGYDTCEIPLPGVVSVVKEINEPRLPSLKGKMRAKKAPIATFSAAALGVDTAKVGPNSPTTIVRSQPPPTRKKGEILEGEPDDVAAKLFDKLRADQII